LRYCITKSHEMNTKILLFCLVLLSSFLIRAQNKTFSYSNVQTRNSAMQWGEKQAVKSQSVIFSPDQISLKIDQVYHLTILSKTHLPDKGIIYLCQDEKSNPITVMLFSDVKMYLYNKTKRFLINFEKGKKLKA